MKTVFSFLAVLLLFLGTASAQDNKRSGALGNENITPERALQYNNSLLGKKLEYDLLPEEKGFKLKFITNPEDYLDIKIFDVIGNLVLTESVKMPESSEKIYYFEESQNRVYVVKVQSGNQNLVKKITF